MRQDRAVRRVLALAAALLLTLTVGCARTEAPPAQQSAIAASPAVSAAEQPSEPQPESEPAPEPPADPRPEPQPEPEPPAPEPEPSDPEPPAEDDSWMLLLVNADNPLPEDFTVSLKALRNGQSVDERIYPALQQMFDDARAQGVWPLINESFRTFERQQEIMDKYIARYEAGGSSHDDAVKQARAIVALPGTSEHQLGLALDIIAEKGDNETVWAWLRQNAPRYGFILRYPADKEEITGISYEPWHFRYVGVDDALAITEAGVALEEYLAAIPAAE